MQKKNKEKFKHANKKLVTPLKPGITDPLVNKTQKRKWWVYGSILLILMITAFVYLPSLDNAFTNWDDNVYVTENKLIQDHADLKTIMITPVGGNYHPLTILSLLWDQNRSAQLDPESLLGRLVSRTRRSASSAVRRRAGAYAEGGLWSLLGSGSAERHFVPHRVRDTKTARISPVSGRYRGISAAAACGWRRDRGH